MSSGKIKNHRLVPKTIINEIKEDLKRLTLGKNIGVGGIPFEV